MTYLVKKELSVVMIEATLSSAQTASQNDYVLFDTLRATGSHGVSLNSSTGAITLDTSKHYHIQASVDVERATATDSWRFNFADSNGTELTPEQGAFDATHEHQAKTISIGAASPTNTIIYQSTQPRSEIRLKAFTLGASSTITTDFSLLILEVTPQDHNDAPALFHAWNKDARDLTLWTGGTFSLDRFSNCGGSSNTIENKRSIVYGEIRAHAGNGQRIGYTLYLNNTTTEKAEGPQVGSNIQSSILLADDGAHGVVEGACSLKMGAAVSTNTDGVSDYEETRIFGIRIDHT